MQPTDYGLGQILTSPLVLGGILLILGGGGALLWMFRDALGYYEPEIPPVVQPPVEDTFIRPARPVAPNYRRPDSDTAVIRPPWAPLDMYRDAPPFVPHIPGAKPEAGPVCPFCGGPWHALCPSAPKERTDETVVLPVVPPVAELAPPYAALSRFFAAVDEARTDTDQAMHRIAANVRPDCPLTTQEIPDVTLQDPNPAFAAQKRGDTVELSEVMKKVSAP